jgi:hypothetical protein
MSVSESRMRRFAARRETTDEIVRARGWARHRSRTAFDPTMARGTPQQERSGAAVY